jgi:plasmid stabilization system protein ParE
MGSMSVVVSPTARRNLGELIESHALPDNTRERVRRSIEPLARFPLLGAPLEERWSGLRFILGPWRWMIIVYAYDEQADEVAVVTIQDGRSARGPRSAGG